MLDLIPHRDPFLLIDKVVDIAEDRIHASRWVDPASDFFRGHYPGNPVMPGVLICECVFQAGAILIAHRLQSQNANLSQESGIPVITRIQDARFKSMVRPGQTLDIKVKLDDVLDKAYFLTGNVASDSIKVLRVSFACMLAENAGD